MSLAPSSTISASASAGTAQSKRASPSSAVSPETPALTTATSHPFALQRRLELVGKGLARRQRRSPRSGCRPAPRASGCAPRPARRAPSPATAAQRHRLDEVRQCPYEGDPAFRISGTMSLPAVAMRGVDLSLGRGAARVHILRDVSLTIAQGRGGRRRRAVGLGQVDPAHDHGRARTAGPRRGLDRRREPRDLERGRARALPRRAHRHRVPVLPSHPDHDGARERRGAARARRPARRLRPRPRGARAGRARRTG